MTEAEIRRQAAKTAERRFLNILEQEFRYPPKIAQAILAEAEACLLSQGQGRLQAGQIRRILVKREAGHGRALREAAMTEVVWTIDAGVADVEYQGKHGAQKLRQHRLERLAEEAVAQGAVATQEDLAQVLQVSVRTIKRDCAQLEEAKKMIPLRGKLHSIGRGQSHKGQIIRRWLQGETYDQLERHTGHKTSSIRRYISTFVRVVDCQARGFDEETTAHLLQITPGLVGQYLQVYAENDTPFCRQRLEEQRQRLSQTPPKKRRPR